MATDNDGRGSNNFGGGGKVLVGAFPQTVTAGTSQPIVHLAALRHAKQGTSDIRLESPAGSVLCPHCNATGRPRQSGWDKIIARITRGRPQSRCVIVAEKKLVDAINRYNLFAEIQGSPLFCREDIWNA